MAADPQPTPPSEPETDEAKAAKEAEEGFWNTHAEKTKGVLDEWFEGKKKEFQAMGTSRTGGRSSLPAILANIMFGPEKK